MKWILWFRIGIASLKSDELPKIYYSTFNRGTKGANMKKCYRVSFVGVAICVSLYSTCALSIGKGQETAEQMTINYMKRGGCVSGTTPMPAYMCGGVLVRTTDPDTSYHSWDPSPASVTSGGVSFSYLDFGSHIYSLFDGVDNGNGVAFYPYDQIPAGKNKDIEVLCAYPVNAGTNSRPDKGCGGTGKAQPCQQQGIINHAQWLTNYESSGKPICGFDVRESSQYYNPHTFSEVLLARTVTSAYKGHNELRLATWDTAAAGYPRNLPIQAFFYTAKHNAKTPIAKGLTGARHDQEDYYKLTGIWVPIIKIQLRNEQEYYTKFSYNNQDQSIPEPPSPPSEGDKMASYMTSNYNKIASDCGSPGKPAFMCSGVMIRATNPDTDYNSWDPSPASVQSGGVSFSYLRRDAKFDKLAYGYLNGIAFAPHDYVAPGTDKNFEVLCSFPLDAGTEFRSDKGCGASSYYPTESVACQSQNITDEHGWIKHFSSVSNPTNQRAHQCGFMVSKSTPSGAEAFYNSIKARALVQGAINTQNEIRIATWDVNSSGYPKTLPIEAFFYIYKQSSVMTRAAVEKGLKGAQHDQKAFFNKTGKWIPIIRVSLPDTISSDVKFEYSRLDQVVPESKVNDA